MNLIRMQIELAADASMNSVLAEYNRELFSKYDLLFVDTSYCGKTPSLSHTEDHLRHYLGENLATKTFAGGLFGGARSFTAVSPGQVVVTEARFAADDNGRPLREQVSAYIAADPLEAPLSGFLSKIDVLHGFEIGGASFQEEKQRTFEALEAFKEEARDRARAEYEAGDKLEEFHEPDTSEPSEPARSFMGQFVLSQVLPGGGYSEAYVDAGKLLSHRTIHHGTGLVPENTHGYPPADELLFDEYILEKCGDFATHQSKGPLSYEVEYILEGKNSDSENLAGVVEKLLAIRETANCISIFGDERRQGEAEVLAAVVSFLCFVPEAVDVVKAAILFAWAYVETLSDVKTLLAGGRVPLVKSPSNWETSIFSILTPGSAPIRHDNSGVSYRDYLRFFLYLQGGTLKTYRFMDVVEEVIRSTPYNGNFRMDWCMDAYTLAADFKSHFGYSYDFKRTISYN